MWFVCNLSLLLLLLLGGVAEAVVDDGGEVEEDGAGEGTERVPPTICLTAPAWRSMQGRKRVIVFSFGFLGGFWGVGGGERRGWCFGVFDSTFTRGAWRVVRWRKLACVQMKIYIVVFSLQETRMRLREKKFGESSEIKKNSGQNTNKQSAQSTSPSCSYRHHTKPTT